MQKAAVAVTTCHDEHSISLAEPSNVYPLAFQSAVKHVINLIRVDTRLLSTGEAAGLISLLINLQCTTVLSCNLCTSSIVFLPVFA